jgi:hypothetical protein
MTTILLINIALDLAAIVAVTFVMTRMATFGRAGRAAPAIGVVSAARPPQPARSRHPPARRGAPRAS